MSFRCWKIKKKKTINSLSLSFSLSLLFLCDPALATFWSRITGVGKDRRGQREYWPGCHMACKTESGHTLGLKGICPGNKPSVHQQMPKQNTVYMYKGILFRLCCCSIAKSCLTLCDPWTAARQSSLSFTISRSLLKLMSIESVMPYNHLILCCLLLLLPSVFPESGSFPVSWLFASGGQSIQP